MLSKSQVKYIQSLGQKKRRDEEDVFIAEAPKLVAELLQEKNVVIKEIFAVKEWINANKEFLNKVVVTEITESELEKISLLTTPHLVLAVVEKIKWPKNYNLDGSISLALDTIQDPGNFGTIIRTADWFGINRIFCNNHSADIYNPKSVQASMGSIARVKLEYVELVDWLRENKGIRTYAATLDGRDITKMEKINEGIIIIGNEARGIQEDILRSANVKITIPKKGRTESLNAAVATGIILSHII